MTLGVRKELLKNSMIEAQLMQLERKFPVHVAWHYFNPEVDIGFTEEPHNFIKIFLVGGPNAKHSITLPEMGPSLYQKGRSITELFYMYL